MLPSPPPRVLETRYRIQWGQTIVAILVAPPIDGDPVGGWYMKTFAGELDVPNRQQLMQRVLHTHEYLRGAGWLRQAPDDANAWLQAEADRHRRHSAARELEMARLMLEPAPGRKLRADLALLLESAALLLHTRERNADTTAAAREVGDELIMAASLLRSLEDAHG